MYYDVNEGLPLWELPNFIRAAGLTGETPKNYSPLGWADALRRFGPLSVATQEKLAPDQAFNHARILQGFSGNCDSSAMMSFIDPEGGQTKTATYKAFMAIFDAYSGVPGSPLQVFHL